MIDLDQLEARRRLEAAQRTQRIRDADRIFLGFGVAIFVAAIVMLALAWLDGCSSYSDCGDAGPCGCTSNSQCGYSEICRDGECWAFEAQPASTSIQEVRDGN